MMGEACLICSEQCVGAGEEQCYVGWIPCLAGRMFFRNSKPALADYDVVNVNVLVQDVAHETAIRYVIASSVYNWKDSGAFFEHGLFRVVVSGASLDPKNLSGRIYLLRQKQRYLAQRNAEGGLWTLFESATAAANVLAGDPSELDSADAKSTLSRLTDRSHKQSLETYLLQNVALAIEAVEFVIDETGFTRVSFAGHKGESSKEFTTAGIPIDHRDVVTRQSFYYLKYLFHRHTHHHKSNDSLTRAHVCRKNGPRIAHMLIDDLKRGLVDMKRAARHEQHDIAGIATYGKSLVLSCWRKGLFKTDERTDCEKVQAGYFDNLSESIRYLHDGAVTVRGTFKSFLTILHQVTALVFLFVTPFIISSVNRGNQEKRFAEALDVQNSPLGETAAGLINAYVKNLLSGSGSAILTTFFVVFLIASSTALFLRDRTMLEGRRDDGRLDLSSIARMSGRILRRLAMLPVLGRMMVIDFRNARFRKDGLQLLKSFLAITGLLIVLWLAAEHLIHLYA